MKTLQKILSIVSLSLLFFVVTSSHAQDRNNVMNIVYPTPAFAQSGGPVINIKNTTLFSPNAVGDGVTDDTAAFVAMMNYLKAQVQALNGGDPKKIMYIPSGTYLVSNTITYSGANYNLFCRLRLIGQNRANTIIKLKNNSAGFGVGTKKPVLTWTKLVEQGNVMWGNQLRNLTIDTGTGNPGAVGVNFLGANGCSIDNLTVRSGDGQGYAGLNFPWWSVQGHFSDITVQGFDYGIRAGDNVNESNPVLEYVTVSGQNIAGVQVSRAAACLRKIKSTNTVPGVLVDNTGAHVIVVDSEFTGGSAANAALVLTNSSSSQLFARNVSVAGYGSSIRNNGANALTGYVSEWRSGSVYAFDANVPSLTMNLPVEEAPLVPWESNPANWANPDEFAGSNDAQKIQAALNSGKPAIYFPRYYFVANTTPLTVPATVRQIDFMTSESWLWGGLNVTQSSNEPLFIEHSSRKVLVRINAPRTLVSRFGSISYEVNTTEPVVAHFQTGAVLAGAHQLKFCPPNARIYARSINEESRTTTNFLVNGGLLWVLGYKTEADQTAFEARSGGFLEVLGGYQNFAATADTGKPTVLNNNSNVSYIGTNFMSRNYQQAIWEIRNGVTSRFLNANFPRRSTGHTGNYFIPLYVGYDPAVVPQNSLLDETFDAGSAIAGQTAFITKFNVNTSAGNIWSHALTRGTGNTGRISAPSGQNVGAVNKTTVGALATGKTLVYSLDGYLNFNSSLTYGVDFSMLVRGDTAVSNTGTCMSVRIANNPAYNATTSPHKYILLLDGIQFATLAGTNPTGYYLFQLELTKDATGKIDAVFSVYNVGVDGTANPTLRGTWNQPDRTNSIATAPSLYLGWMGRARSGVGVSGVDNFFVK